MSEKVEVPTKLLWVDLEMTGLDPVNDVILEISAVVTDFDFKILAKYEAIIFHPESKLSNINEWSKNQHTTSGLLSKVKSGKPEKEFIKEFEKFIRDNFGKEPAILAGNSIHTDRRFIIQHWPEIDSMLHYRMLDVSSWKVFMSAKHNLLYTKQETHRAQQDINESINELKYYLDWFAKNGS